MYNVAHSNFWRPENFFRRCAVIVVVVGDLLELVGLHLGVVLLVLSVLDIIVLARQGALVARHDGAFFSLCFTFTQLVFQICHFFFHSEKLI